MPVGSAEHVARFYLPVDHSLAVQVGEGRAQLTGDGQEVAQRRTGALGGCRAGALAGCSGGTLAGCRAAALANRWGAQPGRLVRGLRRAGNLRRLGRKLTLPAQHRGERAALEQLHRVPGDAALRCADGQDLDHARMPESGTGPGLATQARERPFSHSAHCLDGHLTARPRSASRDRRCRRRLRRSFPVGRSRR